MIMNRKSCLDRVGKSDCLSRKYKVKSHHFEITELSVTAKSNFFVTTMCQKGQFIVALGCVRILYFTVFSLLNHLLKTNKTKVEPFLPLTILPFS